MISDSALRINCFLSTKRQEDFAHREELVKFIISDYLRSNKSLGQFISVVGLSYLLTSQDTSLYFLNFDGMEMLFSILKSSEIDISIVYYGLLCVWSLSFYEQSIKDILIPQNNFFGILERLMYIFPKLKIIRIVCKILKNLFHFPKMLTIIISQKNLINMLKIYLKKDIKDESLIKILKQVMNRINNLKSSILFFYKNIFLIYLFYRL